MLPRVVSLSSLCIWCCGRLPTQRRSIEALINSSARPRRSSPSSQASPRMYLLSFNRVQMEHHLVLNPPILLNTNILKLYVLLSYSCGFPSPVPQRQFFFLLHRSILFVRQYAWLVTPVHTKLFWLLQMMVQLPSQPMRPFRVTRGNFNYLNQCPADFTLPNLLVSLSKCSWWIGGHACTQNDTLVWGIQSIHMIILSQWFLFVASMCSFSFFLYWT